MRDGGEKEEDGVEVGGADVGAEVPEDVGVGGVGAGHFVKRDKRKWGVEWRAGFWSNSTGET